MIPGYPAPVRGILVASLALALAPAALAGGPTLRIGVAEDAVKRPTLAETKAQLDLLKLAGLDTVRVSETWTPGTKEIAGDDLAQLQNIAGAAALDGLEVYVSVSQYGSATTPLSDDDQAAFASYSASIARRFPLLAGIIVGNEPNLNRFWLPQFDADGHDVAAPAFEALLAKTYDAIKAAEPALQVIGVGLSPRGGDRDGIRPTHSPTVFIQDLGAAYRASGRTAPIMDALGFHPYGDNSSQPPSFQHPNTTSIGMGDYDKLVALLGAAFDGTAQSGSTLPILYDEYGVETQIPTTKIALYANTEKPTSVPTDEATQGSYYTQALALAFCQPNVEGILLFHAFDEGDLQGWQSGVYYADETPKPSLAVVRAVADATRRGIVAHCAGLQLTPKLRYLLWPRVAQLRTGAFRVLLTCDIDCRVDARVATQRLIAVAVGGVRTTIAFRKRLPAGKYRVSLTLTATVNPGTPFYRQSPPLAVPRRK
jgi:hypothetical protein